MRTRARVAIVVFEWLLGVGLAHLVDLAAESTLGAPLLAARFAPALFDPRALELVGRMIVGALVPMLAFAIEERRPAIHRDLVAFLPLVVGGALEAKFGLPWSGDAEAIALVAVLAPAVVLVEPLCRRPGWSVFSRTLLPALLAMIGFDLWDPAGEIGYFVRSGQAWLLILAVTIAAMESFRPSKLWSSRQYVSAILVAGYWACAFWLLVANGRTGNSWHGAGLLYCWIT